MIGNKMHGNVSEYRENEVNRSHRVFMILDATNFVIASVLLHWKLFKVVWLLPSF